MAEPIRIVIDTNVLVAALRSKRGAANRLLMYLHDPQIAVAVSTALLIEYEEVLKRPEMSSFISPSKVDTVIEDIYSISTRFEIFFLWRVLAVDADDAFILELAVRSQADYIVTYNQKDFAAASEFGVKLITPKEFLTLLGKT
jgi:putative PIN family toxin of toxin-antitoxin system